MKLQLSIYKFIFAIIVINLSLVGCGGSSTPSNLDNDDPIVVNRLNTNLVELGPLTGSTVSIDSLDKSWHFYTAITDEYGRYSIDMTTFKASLSSMSPYPEYVLVSATGGLDIDPEDDGDTTNSQAIPVNGLVKGIFSVHTILNNDNLSINLLSTAVSEILEGKNKIDDDQITYIAKEIGIEDLNDDGKIDNRDIYLYRMSEHESSVEQRLRDNLLASIHAGDSNKIESVTSTLIKDFNLMFVEYSISAGVAYLDIKKSTDSFQIMYALNAEKGDLLDRIYSSSIPLHKNDYVVYKECGDNKCSPIQIASFDGEKLHQYFLRLSDFGIYSDIAYMNSLRTSINTDSTTLNNVEKNILNTDSKIHLIDQEIDVLDSKINDIKSSVDSQVL